MNNVTLFDKADIVEEQEVTLELNAQYQAAINAGLTINHIDMAIADGVFKKPQKPRVYSASIQIGLPVRRIDNIVNGGSTLKVATPDAFDMRFFDDGVSLARLQDLLLSYQTTNAERGCRIDVSPIAFCH
ncbi:hypothetical protein O9992_15135 [Vibrio lentus]|nr:hypothetical protein [Vibrio lentus]